MLKTNLITKKIGYKISWNPLYKLQSQVTSDKETNKKKNKLYKKMLTYVYSIKISLEET